MPETYEEISARRQNLIRASRVHPNPEFGPLIDASNADDLEWLLEQIDTQIGETPNWVDDRASLGQIWQGLGLSALRWPAHLVIGGQRKS